MADPLRKVNPGDPLQFRAATYNAMIDAARAQREGRALIRGTGISGKAAGDVRVRNDSGANRAAYDVVGILGPLFGPAEHLNEFQRRAVLRVGVPDADAAAAGRIAILAEPLAPGRIGRAYVAGVCAARVKIRDPLHACAVPVAGTADQLESAARGPVQLLWAEAVAPDSVAWAIIRFGGVGGIDLAVWVRVKKTGGDWGSATEQCSWIYDLYGTEGGLTPDNLIVAGVSNVFGRAAAGRYQAAGDGTLALALVDPEGEYGDPSSWTLLVVVDEVEDIAVCNSAPVGG